MRFITADEIRSALTFPLLVDALEAAHRRAPMPVQDAFLGEESALYFVRHAADPGRHFVSKLITSFPRNPETRGLPAVQAVVVLFDATDGRALAVMDGTELTYWRTAADSALGARCLARRDARTLLVVGAGEMSTRLVHAHRAVRPSLERVRIWNRTSSRAQEVAHALCAAGVDAEPVDDLRAAVHEADVVTCCTRSRTPLVHGEDLRPGAHLDLVGGYTPDHREADDEAARRARIYVDRRESAFHGVGDILQPIASGAITEADVLGDLHDLVAGRGGRASDEDITMFKNAGGGHLDLMTAVLVHERVEARGDMR